MNMLDFSRNAIGELNQLTGKNFARRFISLKSEFYHKFQRGLITSTIHGADFFSNIIRYYGCPEKWIEGDEKSIYAENFREIIRRNK